MRTFGLRSKLVLTFASLFLVAILVFAGYLIHRQRIIASEALETRARALTTIVAKLIAPAVELDLDKAQAEASLGVIKGHKDLLYITVLTSNGTNYLSHREAAASSGSEVLENVDPSKFERPGAILQVSEPIRSNGKDLGTLVAGFSRQSVEQEIQTSTRTVLLFTAAMLVAGLLLAWLVFGIVARPMVAMTTDLSRLSQELAGLAQSLENARGKQGAVIDETCGTMEGMLVSAQQITESSSVMLGNAELAVTGNRDVARRIQDFNNQAEKVAEILATIMQVADRTDLLALNAALEGTKAGEAGRGFTLVAAEMRRLAESVMESVAGIRRLMNDMRAASHSAVVAGQESVALSEETTRSARAIASVTQRQQKATERVRHSMDAVTTTGSQATAFARQAASTATDLVDAALRLDRLVGSRAVFGQPPSAGKISRDPIPANAETAALSEE